MDRRLFLKGTAAGIAGLSFPDMALPAWLRQPALSGKSLWSGSNGHSAGSCRVIGIGGAGCNIVRAAWSSSVRENADQRPEFTCVDLGEQALRYVGAASENHPKQTPIKTVPLAPVGAGGWVNGARAVALRQRHVLQALVAGADMVVLVAGMGGGTGSGVTPILARLAREAGALTVATVVTPFADEGVRQRKASTAIRYLQSEADLVMEFSNEGWSQNLPDSASMTDLFSSLDHSVGSRIVQLTCAICPRRIP